MGWDSCSTWRTKKDAVNDYTNTLFKSGYQVLDQAGTPQGHYWLVAKPGGPSHIVCAIFRKDKFDFRHQDRDPHFQIWMKTLSEDVGPAMNDCPARIINKACETKSEYAKAFRKECLERQDLTGKTIEIYKKRYRVTGKPPRKKCYHMVSLEDGKPYYLSRYQESICEIVNVTRKRA